MSVAAESVSSIWTYTEVSFALTEKEEKGNTSKTEIEKEESKDKISQWENLLTETDADRVLHVLDNINIRFSPYLSLPELPPEQA